MNTTKHAKHTKDVLSHAKPRSREEHEDGNVNTVT